NPGNEAELYQMGTLNEAEGKLKDAETAYRKSFEANPQNVRALQAISDLRRRRRDAAGALAVFGEELKRFPSNTILRTAYADNAFLSGRYQVAASEYQILLPQLQKDYKASGDMYLRLGEVYR